MRFARDDPETQPTMDEQIALARKAAQKLGIPQLLSKPLYRIGLNLSHRRGLGLRGMGLGGASVDPQSAPHRGP